jgi:hypothetical protein
MSYYEDTSYYHYSEPAHYDDTTYYDDNTAEPYYDNNTSYNDDSDTTPGLFYYEDTPLYDETESTYLNGATTWPPPPPLTQYTSATSYEILSEQELESYAEAASSRIYTLDEIHPAYRNLPVVNDYVDSDSTDPDPPSGHWIQARPIHLLTTHIPDEPPEVYTESMYSPTIDDDEYIDVTDEYLEQVAQQVAEVRRQMAEWDAEDAAEVAEEAEEAEEETVILLDLDDTSPVPPYDLPNVITHYSAPPPDFTDVPAVSDTASSVANDHQISFEQDRPAPVHHPPLRTPSHKLSYPSRPPPPRHRPSRPTSPRSPRPQYAVKHRARFRNNRSTQTDETPHLGPPPSQAKDPPQPFDLSSLHHVPPHLLQSTLDDALRLVAHLSRRAGAERRISKKAGKTVN